jgi:hypothetical protein
MELRGKFTVTPVQYVRRVKQSEDAFVDVEFCVGRQDLAVLDESGTIEKLLFSAINETVDSDGVVIAVPLQDKIIPGKVVEFSKSWARWTASDDVAPHRFAVESKLLRCRVGPDAYTAYLYWRFWFSDLTAMSLINNSIGEAATVEFEPMQISLPLGS